MCCMYPSYLPQVTGIKLVWAGFISTGMVLHTGSAFLCCDYDHACLSGPLVNPAGTPLCQDSSQLSSVTSNVLSNIGSIMFFLIPPRWRDVLRGLVCMSWDNKTHSVGITYRWGTHCGSGKAISTQYSECEFVALVTQHATCMHHKIICGLSGSTIFCNIIA